MLMRSISIINCARRGRPALRVAGGVAARCARVVACSSRQGFFASRMICDFSRVRRRAEQTKITKLKLRAKQDATGAVDEAVSNLRIELPDLMHAKAAFEEVHTGRTRDTKCMRALGGAA